MNKNIYLPLLAAAVAAEAVSGCGGAAVESYRIGRVAEVADQPGRLAVATCVRYDNLAGEPVVRRLFLPDHYNGLEYPMVETIKIAGGSGRTVDAADIPFYDFVGQPTSTSVDQAPLSYGDTECVAPLNNPDGIQLVPGDFAVLGGDGRVVTEAFIASSTT